MWVGCGEGAQQSLLVLRSQGRDGTHLLGGIDDASVVAKLQGAKNSREYGKDQGPSDSLPRGFPILGRQKQRGGMSHGTVASFLPPGAQAQ